MEAYCCRYIESHVSKQDSQVEHKDLTTTSWRWINPHFLTLSLSLGELGGLDTMDLELMILFDEDAEVVIAGSDPSLALFFSPENFSDIQTVLVMI